MTSRGRQFAEMNEEPRTIDTDVVVVGAGGCGLTAALSAAERGSRVVLLEQASAPGGSTALSAGLFVAAGSRLQTANGELGSPNELAEDVLALNGRQSDPALTLALCRASGPLIDWLETRGVPLEHIGGYRYAGMSRDWLIGTPQRHGAELVEAMVNALKRHLEVSMVLDTAVTDLIVSGGKVMGVEATTASGDGWEVSARAVILGASGFGANADMVARYIPDMAEAAYFGTPFATGDAIQWGQACGAAVAHMSAYQPHSSIAYPEQLLVTTYLINHGAIQVNEAGLRFGNETDSYAGHAVAVQRQPDRAVVEIFDEEILNKTLRNYPRIKDVLEAGIVHSGESLDRLAAIFGLNSANVKATVAAYNAVPADGVDEFGRPGSGHRIAAPYYGIRVTSALVQTLGGLRVDAWARVLRADGTPIPGLYAGGGTAAGLAGEKPEGYLAGTGLLAAFGLGWIAGREASP